MAKKKPKTKRKIGLNLKEEIFCQLYAGYGERSLMSNGTLSYIQAWGIDTGTSRQLKKWKKDLPAYWDYPPQYKVAKTQAHTLLTNPDIKARIYSLFRLLFSADTADSELLSVIMQSTDLNSKVAAIREFNSLKGRIIKRIKLSGALKSQLPADRLAEVAAHVLKTLNQK